MLYDDLYFSKAIKNDSQLSRKLPHTKGKLGVDFVGTYDGDRIMFYYLIQSFPRKLAIDFKDRVRRECRGDVKVNFLNYIRQHKIDWHSTQMQSRLKVLRQVGQETDDKQVDAYNMYENISSMGKQSWIEDSLGYLAVADLERERALVKSSVLMTVAGYKGAEFDDSVTAIEEYAEHLGIKLQRVLYDIPDVLRYFSPFHRTASKHSSSNITTQVLTDEIVARYSVYSQGTLGVKGTYFGTDIYSKFPVLKRVKPQVDTAENWLFTAETGGGKSHLVKDIILQLIGDNYNGTIMDVEGFEYIPLANFLSHKSKVEVINMAEGSGRYFDPVEIAELTGDEDIDKDAKNMSVNFTLAFFKTILQRVYNEDTWVDTVLNDGIAEVYADAGVTNDRTTWVKSKGKTLLDVYEAFPKLRGKHKNDGYYFAIEKVIAGASKYFEPDGTRSGMIQERVVISDIVDANLVVCSFGMAGKSPQAVDEVQLALMQLGAAQLSHQRSIFSKMRGKFNFKVWEEFQRWGKFPDADKTIGVAVTGGRKLGDVNIIITNDVAQILNDDKFSILSNVTSYMIGAIADDKVRGALLSRLSIDHMKPDLDKIAKAAKVDDEGAMIDGVERPDEEEDPYRYAFLCGLDNNKFGITKIVLPKDLSKSKLFKTGVDLTG